MNINIGTKKPIDGDEVFLVGSFLTAADPPFVLLYDSVKGKRAKRNIQKIDPIQVVASIGIEHFLELEYLHWGKVWIRSSNVRSVRECSEDEMRYSSEEIGSLVLFNHDPTPEDEHACFFFFGMPARLVARLLNREVEVQCQRNNGGQTPIKFNLTPFSGIKYAAGPIDMGASSSYIYSA